MIAAWRPHLPHDTSPALWLLPAVLIGAITLGFGLPQANRPASPSQTVSESLRIPGGPAGRNLRAALRSLDGTIITPGRPLAVVADVIVPMRPEDGYCFAPGAGVVVAHFGGGADRLLGPLQECCEQAGLRTQWRTLPPRSRYLLPFDRDLAIHCPPGEVLSFSANCSAEMAEISVLRTPLDVSGVSTSPAGRPSGPERIITVCVGDILLDGVAMPVTAGASGDVCDLLSSADVTLANLEAPVTSRTRPTPFKSHEAISAGREFLFRTPPGCALPALQHFGVDGVCLANNHALDYRPGGLEDTIAALDDAGIASAGAGLENRARQPMDIGGMRLLSYVEDRTLPGAEDFATTADRPGVAVVTLNNSGPCAETAEMVQADIQRAAGPGNPVIVGVHWGEEGMCEPAPRQVAFARFCVEAGADVVWGHHPHVLQPLEVYRGGLIAYSLGNFVFPAPPHEPLLSSAILVTCHQDGALAAAGLVAVVLDADASPYGLPELALSRPRRELIRSRLIDVGG